MKRKGTDVFDLQQFSAVESLNKNYVGSGLLFQVTLFSQSLCKKHLQSFKETDSTHGLLNLNFVHALKLLEGFFNAFKFYNLSRDCFGSLSKKVLKNKISKITLGLKTERKGDSECS